MTKLSDKISQPEKALERLARDLLAIAKMAMPDTYFVNDRRCQHARYVLKTVKKL